MLGYENYKVSGDETEYPPYQGIIGGMSSYPFTPHQISMAAQQWGMMMNNGPGGSLPPPPPGTGPTHPHFHPSHSIQPSPSFQHMPLPPAVTVADLSPKNGQLDELNVPSPAESDNSSSGSLSRQQPRQNHPSYTSTPVSPPPSRERFSYTRYQLELLNGIYTKIRYPSSMQKQLIAKRVGITRDQVKVWFQNRRRKDIIGKKNNDIESSTPKMVPGSVLMGVVNELLSYEGEPKGKKAATAQKSYERKVATRRSRQTSESSSHEDFPPIKRQKRSLDDSSDSLPPSKRVHEESSTSSSSSILHNIPHTFQPDTLPVIHFANEPSPGNSVNFDSFSSSSHSPLSFSSASHHDSDITPMNSANNSLVNSTTHSQDSNVSANAIEMVLRGNFRTISSDELDRPAPPNVIVPGVDPAMLQRPRSLESPAADPYIPVTSGTNTTDAGLHVQCGTIATDNNTANTIQFDTSSIHTTENDLANLQVIAASESLKETNNDLDLSKENELHLTTTPDGCLHVTKISSDKDNIAHAQESNLSAEETVPPKEVAPNKVAPPSEPITFNPKVISTDTLKTNLAPVAVSIAQAEAKAREYERIQNSANNNNHISSTSSVDLSNATPLYTIPELSVPNQNNWQKQDKQMSLPGTMLVDSSFYYPGYSYSGHQPGFLPDPITSNNSMMKPGSCFDKMVPYMMGCMPGFPAPPDPSFVGKNNNNNPAGIFKDVYPPPLLMHSPYGVAGGPNMSYPTYEMPTDLSGGNKKQYL